jgi:2'-5' RNA ligase
MISFRDHIRHKDGTYVALQMRKDSRELLDNFVGMNLGLDERIDPDTYHVTVIYSKMPVPHAEQLDNKRNATATAIGYEVFPTKTGDKCLVLRMDCPEAVAINQHLTELGAVSDYDSYKPHVTVCYNYQGPEDVNELPLPEFAMEFDRLEVKPLDPLFIPANKNDN